MKKRNKYWIRQKEIRRTITELINLRETIRKQEWIELPRPIHQGYNVTYKLRNDIAKTKEAKLLNSLLETYTEKSWCRKKDRSFKNHRGQWDFVTPIHKRVDQKKECLPNNDRHSRVKTSPFINGQTKAPCI